MAPRLIPGFEHTPGVHCGSTAVADVLRCKGLPLSEALCFGLGAGPAFYYVPSGESPTRAFYGRTVTMEEDLCRILGLGFVERTEPDASRAWERVRERVDAGEPVILSTDIRYLPYYRTKTPFNGHRVVLAGYDAEQGVALLADTEREGLQSATLADLARARASDGPPAGFNDSQWWELSVPGEPRTLEEAVPEALRLAATRALADVTGFGGCRALARMASEVEGWSALADLPYVARASFQMIEKRGTGGGLFRGLYAAFLAEAEARTSSLPLAGLAKQMDAIARTWTAFADSLLEVSEGQGGLAKAAELARALAADERRFFEAVQTRFG